MWSSKLVREAKRQVRLAAIAGVALGLVATSCTPSYVTNSTAPVNLIVASVAGQGNTAVLDSDLRIGVNSTGVCPDYAILSLAVRNRNPMAPAPNVPSAVTVRSYEVRYFRTDGRGTEGVDVPYRVTGYLTATFDVRDTGTSSLPIEVVRRQAKMEPPLSTLAQTVNVLTAFAEITVYGETIAGQAVSATGRLQIDFADFADDLDQCPTQPSGGSPQ